MTHDTQADPGRIYRILAQLYLDPPTKSTVADVSKWADSWLKEGTDAMPVAVGGPLGTLSEATPADFESIKTDFPRLFRGASKTSSPDPPYESLYVQGTIYGQPTTTVRNAYLQAGVDIETGEEREAADHLGIELEFLGELRSREAAGDEEAEALQREFIDSHLGQWIGDFEDEVMAADPEPFYGAVVELTTSLIEAEAQRLEEVSSGEHN